MTFLRVIVRSLLLHSVSCHQHFIKGAGLNVGGPQAMLPNKFWRAGRPKNQQAGPGLEYWACAGV